MLSKLLIAFALMAISVVVHAAGLASSVRRLGRVADAAPSSWPVTSWLFIRLASWIVLLHLVEIVVWASFYAWRGAIPELQTAIYFSAVTYTTTGYGDVVLPPQWRLVGAVEALTGILMCGWSTGFFFAVVSRMFRTGPTRVQPAA